MIERYYEKKTPVNLKKSFSQTYREKYLPEIKSLLEDDIEPTKEEIEEILSRKEFGLRDIHMLLQAEGKREFEKLISEKSNLERGKIWKNQLFLVPPLYITSRCMNNCVYCPWRKDNAVKRDCLSMEEFERELDFLINEGYRTIELVGASDPLLKGKDIAEFIRIAKGKLWEVGGGEVGLNFESAESEDYKLFNEAGLDFMVLWQETYHEETYHKMHPGNTRKSRIEYRLDAFDRAIQAGIKKISLAFLGRLYDYKFEVLSLFAHSKYLEEKYGIKPFILGSPRWVYSCGQTLESAPSEYTDNQWKLVASIFKLVLPDTLPWFSTRENFDLSREVIQGGGMLFTLDCSTAVGGYTHKDRFSQFPVYSRNLEEGIKWLRGLGYDPRLRINDEG